MIRSTLALFLLLVGTFSFAQNTSDFLPKQLTEEEIQRALNEGYTFPGTRGIETPPPFPNIRTAAEWEEIQALTISWQGYNGILKQIVAAAVQEVEVIILSENVSQTESYLLNNDFGGPVDLTNVTIIPTALNSIWIRDFGANTVYGDEVDDLFLVDWIYNRPRPDDDVSPQDVADYLGLDLYSTTAAPNDLMNTGGNYMSDGFGTAFASNLVINENQGGNTGWGTQYPDHTEAEIDDIMNTFMGIDTYIKMTALPFDGINHIDMHMKLLNEETLLVSEYPEGVADGPQIEANIQYVLDNFTTKWGTPFNVIRVPAPPQFSNGNYPDQGGWYCTYTNSVFVNNTVLVPTYYEQYDTTALRIYEEALPGYNIVPIDCDNSGNAIISASGAIHCITQSVGVEDPMLISYPCLPNTDDTQNDYTLSAYINHRSGIANANLYWKTDLGASYQSVAMTNTGGNDWEASIPAQPFGTTVYYYVEGTAVNGKVMQRPMTAPEGYKSFQVIDEIFGCTEPTACNYDPLATIDDGTCELAGCTDVNACNYNANAICDDGSCIAGGVTYSITTDCYGEDVTWEIRDDQGNVVATDPPGQYGDQQTFDEFICLPSGCYVFEIFDSYGDGLFGSQYGGCGVDGNYQMTDPDGNILFEMGSPDYGNGQTHNFCVTFDIPGCTDSSACNYDPNANTDDGSCILPDGCDDPNACNFDPAALCDDGSCEYLSCAGCTNALACNYDATATIEDGSCVLPVTWYADTDLDGYGDPNNPQEWCTTPPPTGWSSSANDCDDTRADVYPGAPGTEEGIDNNCNGLVEGPELTPEPCFGDLDGNGIISSADLLIILSDYGCASGCNADLTGDDLVNASDVLSFLSVFGEECP